MESTSINKFKTELNAIKLTCSPKHHFFGFHDVCAWNHTGDKVAALRVDVIDRPPTGSDVAEAGFIDLKSGVFKALIETTAFNFPQGARQLWTPKGGFWVNIRLQDKWGAVHVDENGQRRQTIEQSLYAISKDGTVGWGLNFARLNRLAGYGYVGLADHTESEVAPSADGIWSVDLVNGCPNLLVSIKEVAASTAGQSGEGHHYITHIVPSPSNHRLLFLHRYWLGDGGLQNRLMSINTDGSDLRCHAEGFLSHFDWRDDGRVIIWGRSGTRIDQLRQHPILQIPGLRPLARMAKSVVRSVSVTQAAMRMHFLEIELDSNHTKPLWPEILKEDGHPMFCPVDREWLLIDAYPNSDGIRPLNLLNVVTGQNTSLGNYRMIRDRPDTRFLNKTLEHVDPRILKNVPPTELAFWRSGLHCDLHPRWKADGTMVCFDSIHEGTRQMYSVDVSSIVGRLG